MGSQVYQGYGASIELGDDGLIIRRKGAVSLSLQGLKGEKRIPFASISAIQFKPATLLTSGYIQFSIIGGNENRGGLVAATKDENSVLFKGKKQNAAFEDCRSAIEAGMRAARAHSGSAASSKADELTKLAELMDRGLLTREEFDQQKAALLTTGA